MSKPCNTCGQLFTSTYALEEHILKAPNHPKCATCKKSFRDEKGLEQVGWFIPVMLVGALSTPHP